jgi:hypothetical protein
MSLPAIHSKHDIDYLIFPYQGKVDILWNVVSGNMGKLTYRRNNLRDSKMRSRQPSDYYRKIFKLCLRGE